MIRKNDTRFIYTLDEEKQQAILEMAKQQGYVEEEIVLILNSRVCDLEDTLNVNAQSDLEVKDIRDKECTIVQDTGWHVAVECLEKQLEKEEKKDFNGLLKQNIEENDKGINREKKSPKARTNIKKSSQMERD